MKIITSRWICNKVLYKSTVDTLRATVLAAVAGGADLAGADLRGVDLHNTDLREANLRGADLSNANLHGSDLSNADLGGADLHNTDLGCADLSNTDLPEANLREANLRGADLSNTDLSNADLHNTDLREVNLSNADLYGADLHGADLGAAKHSGPLATVQADLRAVLAAAPYEVPGLLAAVREGRVDGTAYNGPCACLLGTLANVRGCQYTDLGIPPDPHRPAEQWFLALVPGHTPDISIHAALTVAWIEEWLREQAT